MTKLELLIREMVEKFDMLEDYSEILLAEFKFTTDELEVVEVKIDFTKDKNFITITEEKS